jgi:hypothetical protein
VSVKYLMHLPFVFFAIWLGGGLWWVSRRLFGNEGGFFSLALYCLCPAILRYAVTPNNEVLAMWGLYGVVYTAIGVAHAMQGPRFKWRPRILLLTLALGLTAAAHLLAAMIGFVASLGFMLYLAERRRSAVMQIVVNSAIGALAIVFGFFAFRLQPFSYVFTGGGARFWFSLDGVRSFATELIDGVAVNAPILVAAGVSFFIYLGTRRSRYFGNTTPLLMVFAIAPLYTTQNVTQPWFWALPFLFTFIGGVFADVLETRYRKLFLAVAGMILISQGAACFISLPALAR